MTSTSLIGLSFIPSLVGAAGALRLAASTAVLAALALALHESRDRDKQHQNRSQNANLPRATKLVASFAIGALAIYGVVAASSQEGDIPNAFDLTLRDDAFNVIPTTQITFEPDGAQFEAVLVEAASSAEEFVDVEGRRAARLISAASASGYQSRSGHGLNWDAAVAQAHRGVQLVTVPLTGNVLDEVSKVVFLHRAGTTSVVEMAAVAVDLATFHLDVWQDGTQVQNVDVTNPEITTGHEVAQAFSWSELNRCLASQGIAWWILGAIAVTCAAVCVGTAGFGCAVCIAGLAGGHVGLAYGCIERANRA